eukprot:417448_1
MNFLLTSSFSRFCGPGVTQFTSHPELKNTYDMLSNIAIPLQPPDDHKISWLWFLAYVLFYVIVGILYMIKGYFWNIILFPLVFFTATIVYLTYKSFVRSNKINGNLVKFTDVFRAFSHGFFGGGLFALLTELWVSAVFLIGMLILVGSSRALKAIMQEDFEEAHDYTCNNILVHLYLAFTSFCVAGLIEEFIKGYLLQYVTKLYLPHTKYLTRSYIKTFVWIGMCIGLGFGTMEGVVYVCIYGGLQGFWNQIILWLIRAFVAIPFHSITGFMWGTQLARRESNKQIEKTWIKMGYQQILLHGLYDFIEMEIALDLVCTSSPTYTQVVVSISVAILYTLFCALLAGLQYKNLMKIGMAEFIPDNEYQPHQAN